MTDKPAFFSKDPLEPEQSGPTPLHALPNEDHSQAPAACQTPCQATSLDRWLTREPAAKALGVSVSTFRRTIEDVVLVPNMDGGVHRFREAEVLEIAVRRRREVSTDTPIREPAPTTRGQLAALVFALFDEGVKLTDVVRRLELEPEYVEQLHTQWARMSGTFVVTGDDAEWIRALDWSGLPSPTSARSGADLVTRLRAMQAALHAYAAPCRKCQVGKREVCLRCLQHEALLIQERTRVAVETRKVEKAMHVSYARRATSKGGVSIYDEPPRAPSAYSAAYHPEPLAREAPLPPEAPAATLRTPTPYGATSPPPPRALCRHAVAHVEPRSSVDRALALARCCPSAFFPSRSRAETRENRFDHSPRMAGPQLRLPRRHHGSEASSSPSPRGWTR